MMSLQQAADAVGRSKSTIFRSIKNGHLSATQDPLGQYKIEECELHRVYPPKSEQQDGSNKTGHRATALEIENRFLKQTIIGLEKDRDHWRDAHLAALRAIPGTTAAAAAPPRRSWWWKRAAV